jgi:hypothetical protein
MVHSLTDYVAKATALVAQMTLEEKALLKGVVERRCCYLATVGGAPTASTGCRSPPSA